VPIREVARDLGIPVPVIAAVRGELESRGLLTRGAGIALTEEGVRVVEDEVGLKCRSVFPVTPPSIPTELTGVSEALAIHASRRPEVDQTLDQSHATCETAIRRAVYLYENDALEGRSLLFLGDDDLTSLSVALVARALGMGLIEMVVADVDPRLVTFINDTASAEGLSIEAFHHDLRSPLPTERTGRFDAFFTDPPYTLDGLALFVSRGVEALIPEVGKQGFVCFGRRSPAETFGMVDRILRSGLAPVEILPTFNDYVGAQLLAGQSQMIRCVSTGSGEPIVLGRYDGPIYTADFRKGRRRGRPS
jgi:predicted methyltransferase